MTNNSHQDKNIKQKSSLKRDVILGVASAVITAFFLYIVASSFNLFEKKITDTQLQEIASLIVNTDSHREVILIKMQSGDFRGKTGDQGKPGPKGNPGGIRSFAIDLSVYDLNTVYQAHYDGIVTVFGYCSVGGGYSVVSGYTDSSVSPSTKVASEMIGGDDYRDNGSFSFPVRKGDYWKVTQGEDPGNEVSCLQSKIRWTPIK